MEYASLPATTNYNPTIETTNFKYDNIIEDKNNLKKSDTIIDSINRSYLKSSRSNLQSIKSISSKSNLSCLNPEVMEHIRILHDNKEIEKNKIYKRKQSYFYRHMHNLNIINIYDPPKVAKVINKSNKATNYGRNKLYLKLLELFNAIAISINILFTIIDTELYISKTDEYIKNIIQSNHTSKIILLRQS